MIYSFSMSEKTIPWNFIESLLAERGKTERGLFAALEVAKSRFSNWKQRGVPLNQAASIAGYIGISTDYLLQKEGAIKEVASIQQQNDLRDAAELLAIFARLSPPDRSEVLGAARDLEMQRRSEGGKVADNQL